MIGGIAWHLLVYLKHKTNGTTYVYENVSYWNKNVKKPKSKRKAGHLEPEKESAPNGMRGRQSKNIRRMKKSPIGFTYVVAYPPFDKYVNIGWHY